MYYQFCKKSNRVRNYLGKEVRNRNVKTCFFRESALKSIQNGYIFFN